VNIWPFKRSRKTTTTEDDPMSDFVPEEAAAVEPQPQPRQASVAPAAQPVAVSAPEPVAAAPAATSAPAPLVGDLNGDGVVDEDDVLIAEMEQAAELVAVRVSQTSESSNAALVSAQAEAQQAARFRAEAEDRAGRAQSELGATQRSNAKLRDALRRAIARLKQLAEG
jgi:hypothetical protein